LSDEQLSQNIHRTVDGDHDFQEHSDAKIQTAVLTTEKNIENFIY